MLNNSAKENKLLLIKYLPYLIKNAINITEKNSTTQKHDKEHFYYIHTEAILRGSKAPVEITLIKRNNKTIQYYNHILPNEEIKKEDVSASAAPESSKEALGTPPYNTSFTNIITEKDVKGQENTNDREVKSNVNDSTDRVATRDSQRVNQNTVGADDESTRTDGRDGNESIEQTAQKALYNEYKDTGVKPDEFDERYYNRLKDAKSKINDVKEKQQKLLEDNTSSAASRQSQLDMINKRRLNIARKVISTK